MGRRDARDARQHAGPYLYPLLQLAQANVAFQDFVEDPMLLAL